MSYNEFEKTAEAARNSVKNALDWSEEHGTTIEVFLWAMMYLRDHPGCTIPEAIDYALEEWLK